MTETRTSLLETTKKTLPTPVWELLRNAWYQMMRLRFARGYWDGLLFDILDREYRTDGMVFEIPREHTRLPHRARFRRDTHERDERDLATTFLPRDACVLELGACLGVVSGVINRHLIDANHHVAVEANPELIPVLTRNRDRNQLGFGIEQALVSRSSNGTFYVSECFVMSSADHAGEKVVQVPVMTLESIEDKHGLLFDTIFMDIQGGEHAFLEENRNFLTRCRCVILELHPHIIGSELSEACRKLLSDAGLRQVERRRLVEAWLRA